MKKFLIATVGLIAFAVPALAADMAPAPYTKAPPMVATVYNWTGFYIGVNVGGDALSSDVNGAIDPNEPTTTAAQKGAVDQIISPRLRNSSVMGGVQAGYNWQRGTWLLGVEGDIDALHARASQTTNPFNILGVVIPGNSSTQSFESNYLATFRGRLGVVLQNRFLLYVTGGLAVADYRNVDTIAFAGPATVQTVASSDTRVGWAVGAGGEYALTPNWSIKAEYLHADLGKANDAIPPYTGFVLTDIQISHHLTEDLGRVGLNYKFNTGPVVAKY
jgi:outer membrane immunogenic protein